MGNSCYVTIMSTSVFHFPEVSEYYQDPCETVFSPVICSALNLTKIRNMSA